LGIKQSRARSEKRKKKKVKESGYPIFSSGGETYHYLGRSIQRGNSGAAKPYIRKQMEELIASGEVGVRKAGKGKKKIYFRDGKSIVVTEDLKTVITFMD